MGALLAYGFSKVGPAFIVLTPILGWIGVALSGSNTGSPSFCVKDELITSILFFNRCFWSHMNFYLISLLQTLSRKVRESRNTSANSLFGLVQVQVGRLLGFPVLLLPSMNSVGAEIGKPVAPQTASVGVSTSKFVRNEGQVIRHNMGWTLVLLVWLILVGLLYYFLLPTTMQ